MAEQLTHFLRQRREFLVPLLILLAFVTVEYAALFLIVRMRSGQSGDRDFASSTESQERDKE